jgi:hypothetical protein
MKNIYTFSFNNQYIFALTTKTVQHQKKRNEDSFTVFLNAVLMLKSLIFVALFLIRMLHATAIQANSSWVNKLSVRSEVVHNILQLQLRNDSRYDD